MYISIDDQRAKVAVENYLRCHTKLATFRRFTPLLPFRSFFERGMRRRLRESAFEVRRVAREA